MSSVGQLNFIFLIVLKIPLLYIDATIIRFGFISFASAGDIIGIELVNKLDLMTFLLLV